MEKDASVVFSSSVAIGDRVNEVYMSTPITYGRGKGIVVNTAMKTEIGKIAKALDNDEEELTPLQKVLEKLGKILGIICAIISSYRNLPVHPGTMIFGEVGLTGEVRGVSYVEQRLTEAVKMGFTRCILPKTNVESLGEKIKSQIQLFGVSNIREVIEIL